MTQTVKLLLSKIPADSSTTTSGDPKMTKTVLLGRWHLVFMVATIPDHESSGQLSVCVSWSLVSYRQLLRPLESPMYFQEPVYCREEHTKQQSHWC